jgi:crotonobetainyl-CoA:carnitine CoA-transferase CaiB-like acyl-CoA transferase
MPCPLSATFIFNGLTMPKDLEGLLVVSVEQAVAAPYVSERLADAGARVVKVERPEGDFARGYDRLVKGESAYFVWLNRGKESICLDLQAAEDRAVLHAMIGQADVFIQNLAPGAIERLGYDPAELRRIYPRLITCSISGYGDTGPYRDMKAYDLLVQAETGLCEITGTPEGPARVGVSVCDIAAGMTAFQAILQALLGRVSSGAGRHISVSLFHSLADWMNVPYLQYVYGGHSPGRSGLNHPTIAPYGAYDCGDGKALLLAIQNEREWVAFCGQCLLQPDVATNPDFDTNPHRLAHRPALDAIIAAAFARASREEIVARFEAARIAYGRVNSLADFSTHPQNRFIRVTTPAGEIDVLAPGATHDGNALFGGKTPSLDEHGAALRCEFGAGGLKENT